MRKKAFTQERSFFSPTECFYFVFRAAIFQVSLLISDQSKRYPQLGNAAPQPLLYFTPGGNICSQLGSLPPPLQAKLPQRRNFYGIFRLVVSVLDLITTQVESKVPGELVDKCCSLFKQVY
jgi:hypothetical protein